MVKQLKIFFQALDGCIGHINACQGLAQTLASRGHEVSFMLHPNQKGRIEKLGFREIVLQLDEKAGHGHAHGHGHNAHPVAATAHEHLKAGTFSDQSPLEKLKSQVEHFESNNHIQSMLHSAIAFTPQIETLLREEKPDLLVLDTFFPSPAILRSDIPWVYLFSANPLGLYHSEKLPPMGAGFPTSSDPSTWAEYKALQSQLASKAFSAYQRRLNAAFDYKPTPDRDPYASGSLFPASPYLNIYGYPKELDYDDIAPMPVKTIRVDAFARSEPGPPFEVPEQIKPGPGEKLIFFSLGSQASANVELMKRILSVLGKTKHKYIVSKGPSADQITLPANCWGEAYLPQPSILPIVDAVITHGGNNTITETFSAGKPMIVMPISGDHLDNAQRIVEKGYGLRLETHKFEDGQLIDAIETVLTDEQLKRKVDAAYKRIQEEKNKERACERMEQLVEMGI